MDISIIFNLKRHGFNPKNILDIGAFHGNWTKDVIKIYPYSKYTLIDAIDYINIQRNNNNNNPNLNYTTVLLAECEKNVDWYELKNTGDSMFKENTAYFKNCIPQKKTTTTLDILFKDKQFDLIKIDVQGAEIPVLKGGIDLIKNTSFIILELPFMGQYNSNVPTFLEHIQFMNHIGFIPYDIIETHKHCNVMIQVDIIFIRKNHPLNTTVQNIIAKFGS